MKTSGTRGNDRSFGDFFLREANAGRGQGRLPTLAAFRLATSEIEAAPFKKPAAAGVECGEEPAPLAPNVPLGPIRLWG